MHIQKAWMPQKISPAFLHMSHGSEAWLQGQATLAAEGVHEVNVDGLWTLVSWVLQITDWKAMAGLDHYCCRSPYISLLFFFLHPVPDTLLLASQRGIAPEACLSWRNPEVQGSTRAVIGNKISIWPSGSESKNVWDPRILVIFKSYSPIHN